jgi:hypothetical protein
MTRTCFLRSTCGSTGASRPREARAGTFVGDPGHARGFLGGHPLMPMVSPDLMERAHRLGRDREPLGEHRGNRRPLDGRALRLGRVRRRDLDRDNAPCVQVGASRRQQLRIQRSAHQHVSETAAAQLARARPDAAASAKRVLAARLHRCASRGERAIPAAYGELPELDDNDGFFS